MGDERLGDERLGDERVKMVESLWNSLTFECNYVSHLSDPIFHFKGSNCFVESTFTKFKNFPISAEIGTEKRQTLFLLVG